MFVFLLQMRDTVQQDVALRLFSVFCALVWGLWLLKVLLSRRYHPVEAYRNEDAEILYVMMGGISETAMTWVDQKRAKGEKVGIVRFRLWRPLPADDFKAAIRGASVVAVLDRHFSPGGAGGPVAQEVKWILYGQPKAPQIVETVVGLGGRDVTFKDFEKIYGTCKAVLGGAKVPPFELTQVRGGHYGEV